MRALLLGRGPEWVLDEVPAPHPQAHEVLVRTRAAATNNADLPMLADADPSNGGSGRESIAGFEYAGEVVALGESVQQWRVGDLVMGSAPQAFADYVTVDERFVLPRPDGMDAVTACALPTGLLTEHGALAVAGYGDGLRPEHRVLITGASTSIGLIGAQVAKALGAGLVLGTTRSPTKRQLLSEHGVDTVIVTGEQDLGDAVAEATDGDGVDIVLDHIGGDLLAQCLPATRVDGRLVTIGRLSGPSSTLDVDQLASRHLTVYGVSFGFTRHEEMARVIAGLSSDVMPAVGRGAIRPPIDQTFAIADHRRGADRLRSGDAVGKVVLIFDGA